MRTIALTQGQLKSLSRFFSVVSSTVCEFNTQQIQHIGRLDLGAAKQPSRPVTKSFCGSANSSIVVMFTAELTTAIKQTPVSILPGSAVNATNALRKHTQKAFTNTSRQKIGRSVLHARTCCRGKRCRRVNVRFNVQHIIESRASCLQLRQSKQIQQLGHQQSGELLQTCFRHNPPASPMPKET